MIVVDANIIVRAVLGRRVRLLLETYSMQGVRFFAPDVAFADAAKYLPELLAKRGVRHQELASTLAYLEEMIESLAQDLYRPFEEEARARLNRRDEDDWPVLASALALGCGVWTEDEDFFGVGVPVWTTSRIELFLRSQAPKPTDEI